MSLTITIPGAVEATIGATAPAILTIGVGTPGATGPAGAAGPGVPVGGTAGQFLTKIDSTNYNTDWTTLPTYLLSSTAASTYQTLAGMSSYLTSSTAASTYATIAAGQPISGTVGQVLTKNSGANYDSSWATLVPGDRYLTSSTTSLSVTNGTKTLTVGTGLSYSPQQDIVIAYDATAHMHAVVTSYNSGTGVLICNVTSHTGSGTFALWTVNVGGTTPLQSVLWGEILGTLGDQSDLATALNAKLEITDAASTYYLQTNPDNFITAAALTPYLPLSGGSLDVNSTITASTATVNSLFAGDTFGLELTANPSENASLQYSGLQVQNAIGSMLVTSSGLTFPNLSTQTIAFPGFNNAALTGDPTAPTPATSDNDTSIATTAFVKAQGYITSAPVTSVAGRTGAITLANTDISGLGTMSTATAADYSTTTVANGLYYPLSGNPSSFLTSSALTPYAPLAGATFTGLVTTAVATAGSAGLNVPHTATAPTSPVNGDIWSTTAGLFVRINAGTKQLMNLGDTQTVSGSITFSNASQTLGNSTAAGTINIASGATTTGLTKTVNIGINGLSGSTTAITVGSSVAGATVSVAINGTLTTTASTQTIGNSTAASTINIASGATTTGLTKAVNIGTGGVAGSTTTIAIGGTAGTSTTTLNGTTNGVTLAADTNSVALATTAYVVGQAGSTAPIIDGTATVGTSLKYARADHVHPTDTSRAALASPTFTGTPLSTTAAADTNTTQIATTAYVIGQVSTTTPANNGTAAVGTSLKYARADHVHASDTTKANLASPTFTGTPAAPTATAGTNTTQLATTAFVTAAVPGFATTAEIASPSSTTKVVAPYDVVRMLVNRATFDTQNSSPTFATSGAGATAYKMTNDRSLEIGTPNILTAGYGQMIYDTTASSWGALGAKRGDNFFTQDFSKKIWMSGTHCFTLLGDANTVTYCMMGGRNTVTTGQPTMQGFGWKLVGGSTALKLITYGYDGVALVVTETASSFTPVANQTFDWMLLNEGSGAGGAGSTCKLYVNDTLVASGINAPGGATVNYNYLFNSSESTVTAATRMSAVVFPIKLWWSKS